MNIHIGRAAKTTIRIQILKEIYRPGMSALDIANAVSSQTGETLSRMVIMGIYTRNRDELAAFPLRQWGEAKREPKQERERRERENEAKRERRRLARIHSDGTKAAAVVARPVERKFEPSKKLAYDAKALLKRLFDLETNECRWPISGAKSDMLFCGRWGAGTYCEHHRLRSVGKGTISELRASSDLRRHAA